MMTTQRSQPVVALKRRRRRVCYSHLLYVALLCGFDAVTASSHGRSTSEAALLDLSYLPNLPATKLAEAVQDRIQGYTTHDAEEEESVLSIDLSYSSLRDSGFHKVLNVLLPLNNAKQNDNNSDNRSDDDKGANLASNESAVPRWNVHLCCRMNDLTPLSTKVLLERMLQSSSSASSSSLSPILISSLDLGWNQLSTDELGGDDNYHPLLEQWLQQPAPHAVQQLFLERCGLTPSTCRALAKGLLGRQQSDSNNQLSLGLARNPWIGNAGTAALAAAIRTWAMPPASDNEDNHEIAGVDEEENASSPPTSSAKQERICLETLDLSGCDISDAGAQALALALEEVMEGCVAVRHLNLSHNQITQEGATALGRALILSSSRNAVQTLDLSDNPIGDRGATSLAAAVEQGKIPNLILRSCQIHADGASAMGKALYTLTTDPQARRVLGSGSDNNGAPGELGLDLSGNPLGVLRGKSKSSSDGGKYSASRLKSTATATAASYMNRIKQGIKDSGFLSGAGATEDSDDEEAQPDEDQDDDSNEDSEESKKRCGAKALANSFLGPEEASENDGDTASSRDSLPTMKVRLGLRHCFFDHGAADALAAILVEAKEERKTEIELDMALNPVLEEDMVDALQGDSMQEDQLAEMAERYMDMLQAIRESKKRAAEARARVRAQRQSEEEADAWYFGDDSEEEEDRTEYHSRRRHRKSSRVSSRFQGDFFDDEDEDSDDDGDFGVEEDAYDDNDWEDEDF